MNTKQVTAICPTLERLDLVKQMVGSFLQVFIPPYPDLVVVSQGPDDGTAGWCRYKGLEVMESPQALSFAQAVNMAAKQSTADWLLLLNNDLILQPSFWQGMEEMAEHGYEVCGAKMLYPNGTIQHYGKWFTLDFYPFHVLRYQPGDHPQAQQPRAFPDVSFACALLRKDIWDSLGGLSEDFVNGFEDDDYCLAAREMGANIGVHHLALATHLESQTTGHDSANKEEQWQKFHRKWVESGRIQWPLGMFQGWRS